MNWLTDCLIRIKNAGASMKNSVEVRGTKVCLEVLRLLKDEGFVSDFNARNDSKTLRQACDVVIKYYKDVPLIKNIKFISTPKNRVYKKCSDLRKYMHDFKFAVVSTDKGIMSAKDSIEKNLGGEILFWIGS